MCDSFAAISRLHYGTVQTFNSCTSRPGVCQCLVVQTPLDNMTKAKHIVDPRKLANQLATFSCEVIHASRKLCGNRVCGHLL